MKSNVWRRLDGSFKITVPEGWQLQSSAKRDLLIYNTKAVVRQSMDVVIPAGAKGTFPIQFQAKVGSKTYDTTAWVAIE